MALLVGADLSTVDVEKIKSLMDLQERYQANEDRKAFFSALSAFQGEMPMVFKSKQESTGKYTYASLDDIMRIARPLLQKHGLSTSFSQSETETILTVVCRVSHIGGHSEETPFSVPKDGPIKTRDGRNITTGAQAQGNANSYARRYCLCNALDIVVTGEDNDCQPAPDYPITPDQSADIHELLAAINDPTVKANMLKWLQVATVEEIPASKFQTVIKNLNAKLAPKS